MSQYMPQPDGSYPSEEPRKGMSVAALILGILGFIPPLGIVAIVLGIVALSRSSRQPQTYGGRGLAIGGIVAGSLTMVFACVIWGLIAIMLPALGQARLAARHIHTQVNLRMIGTGVQMYAADNKDAFPTGDWKAALVPKYVPDASVFEPVDKSQGGDAFAIVPGYTTFAAINSPSTAILAYEINSRPLHGRVGVLYADGHVADVDATLLPQLLPGASGQTPPTAPPPRRGPRAPRGPSNP